MKKAHIREGKFHWKEGVHLPVKAQDFGDWVMSLPDQQPETIVKEARDRKSVAHRLFQWDDAAAAHEHRLVIARRLYGSLVSRLLCTNAILRTCIRSRLSFAVVVANRMSLWRRS